MKQLLSSLVFFLFIGLSGISQDVMENDTIPQDDFLVGIFGREILQQDDFGKYFLDEYQNYNPCSDALQNLKTSIYNKSITVVLATWCHDSQIQLGRFYKILDMLDYDSRNIPNYCLDKENSICTKMEHLNPGEEEGEGHRLFRSELRASQV